MNTYPFNPSSSSNYSQSQSINPALLAGGFSNPQQQQQQRYGGGGGGFGGAGDMGGGVNPAQLVPLVRYLVLVEIWYIPYYLNLTELETGF